MGTGSTECTGGVEGSLEVDGSNSSSYYDYFSYTLSFINNIYKYLLKKIGLSLNYIKQSHTQIREREKFYSQVHTVEFHLCFLNSSLGIINRSIVIEINSCDRHIL